jgi:hypothetical protein
LNARLHVLGAHRAVDLVIFLNEPLGSHLKSVSARRERDFIRGLSSWTEVERG